MQETIHVKGAREHNLKNIEVWIPRDKLVVLTGLSGSGKSSLAFDTIYAEGQRRYVESLSSYARQFLGQMDKPDVDFIEGLSPAISIDQKTTSKNPRSTVGTVTEIYDYLRLLWSRVGTPHCPKCGKEIKQQTIDQIVDQLLALPPRTKLQILAPVVRQRKGEHVKIFTEARKSGYVRVRVDGNLYDLSEEIKLEKNKKHNIEIVVDRIVIKDGKDVAIFATGLMVNEARIAAEQLADEGIDAAVINIHTIKPLDEDIVVEYAKKCGTVVVAEEHSVIGGLGSAICDTLSSKYPCRVIKIGMEDKFGTSGPAVQLLEHFGMCAANIAAKAKEAVSLK